MSKRASVTYDHVITSDNTTNPLVQKIDPESSLETILLHDEISGYTIDATTPTDVYVVALTSSIKVGNKWTVYVRANEEIDLVNITTRDVHVSGLVYLPLLGYTYATTTYPNLYIREEPANIAKYEITVVDVSPTTVYIVYDVVYTNTII